MSPRLRLAVVAAVYVLLNGPAAAQTPVTPGNLVVLRVGDGQSSIATLASAVNLLEINLNPSAPGGVGAVVQTIPVSSSGPSALTLRGTATTEGMLNTSVNGQLITFGGYRANVGAANPSAAASSAVNRVIGVLDLSTGTVNTSQALTDSFSADSIRSVATADGTSFYVGGAGGTQTGGVRYVADTSATTSVPLNNGATTNANVRQVRVQNGNLFTAAAAGNPGVGLFQVGSGLPTSGTQTYSSAGLPTTSVQYHSFYFTRLGTGPTWNPTGSADTGFDTVYLTDTTGNTLAKFSFTGTSWSPNGSVARPGITNIVGQTDGSAVTLYGTDGGNLFTVTDAGGFNISLGTPTFTNLTAAGTNYTFRGVEITPVPVPEPGSVLALAAAGLGLAGLFRLPRPAGRG
jgi:hypothetical protein